jgi:hypothetical protein
MPGKSGNSLIFRGSVLYAHFTISSNVCKRVASPMRKLVPDVIVAEAVNCRKIAITLISITLIISGKGEGKAHTCVNA